MSELTAMRCEACRVGAPLATEAEIAECMPQLPQWQIIECDGIKQLQRVFKFPDFAQALASFPETVARIGMRRGVLEVCANTGRDRRFAGNRRPAALAGRGPAAGVPGGPCAARGHQPGGAVAVVVRGE